MFDTLQMAPPDAILGLSEAFKKDTNPAKINLAVGVFKDARGSTPILACVKEAERRLVERETTKGYLPIDGDAGYALDVQRLLLGAEHEIVTSGRAATVHTPGGTGALRVAGDFLHQCYPGASIWVSKPTWANHAGVFNAAGLQVKSYRYFDAANNALDLTSMLEDLQQAPAGDVVLLHGCCHNPSGIDPTGEQWQQIATLVAERKLLPLVDLAYQGFGDGLRQDVTGLLALCGPGQELIVCSSFSKNFGLYNERVGALTVIAADAALAATALSQVKSAVRANYSNPPAHGAAVVATILNDPELRAGWEQELAAMRDRINAMRRLLVERLAAAGAKRDFSFIQQQRGMFSFSGLTPLQVDRLRTEYAIYIVGSGRINVAAVSEENVDRLAQAIVTVLDE